MTTNTEKPTTKAEQKKNMVGAEKQTKQKATQVPIKKQEAKKEKIIEEDKSNTPEEKPQEKIKSSTSSKVKKDYALVNVKNLPISTKDARAICKFIKNKKISKAIKDLEEVLSLKKAIPMKGEIPHRKGKIMSGRFPLKATRHFIVLLKSLQGNANMNELENPKIVEAISNIGKRPLGRFGIKRKRTHIKIKAIEKKIKKEDEKQKGEKK